MFDDVLVSFKDAQSERVRAYVLGYDGSSVEIGALSVQLGTQCLIKLKTGMTTKYLHIMLQLEFGQMH